MKVIVAYFMMLVTTMTKAILDKNDLYLHALREDYTPEVSSQLVTAVGDDVAYVISSFLPPPLVSVNSILGPLSFDTGTRPVNPTFENGCIYKPLRSMTIELPSKHRVVLATVNEAQFQAKNINIEYAVFSIKYPTGCSPPTLEFYRRDGQESQEANAYLSGEWLNEINQSHLGSYQENGMTHTFIEFLLSPKLNALYTRHFIEDDDLYVTINIPGQCQYTLQNATVQLNSLDQLELQCQNNILLLESLESEKIYTEITKHKKERGDPWKAELAVTNHFREELYDAFRKKYPIQHF